MKATFENSVNVLVKAYLNDTLEHNNCYACAVGNLVASANNFTYTECIDSSKKRIALAENEGKYYGNNRGGAWYGLMDRHVEDKYANNIKIEIESIGYSFDDVIEIEKAFESVSSIDSDRMFNGLMAVVDILAEIHGVDLSVKESAKALFVKAV